MASEEDFEKTGTFKRLELFKLTGSLLLCDAKGAGKLAEYSKNIQ